MSISPFEVYIAKDYGVGTMVYIIPRGRGWLFDEFVAYLDFLVKYKVETKEQFDQVVEEINGVYESLFRRVKESVKLDYSAFDLSDIDFDFPADVNDAGNGGHLLNIWIALKARFDQYVTYLQGQCFESHYSFDPEIDDYREFFKSKTKEFFNKKQEQFFSGDSSSKFSSDAPKREFRRSRPFEILGLEPTATREEIVSAFRKLAHEHHPDKGGDPAIFREIFAAKNEAMMEVDIAV